MGYAATSIVLYGVKLPPRLAQKIYQDFFDDENEFFIATEDADSYFRKIDPYSISKGYTQMGIVTPYTQHNDGHGQPVFNPQMLSDGTDSRCDSLVYSDGAEHYLGIFVASKGYGSQDNISYFIKNLPVEAVANYQKYIAPICRRYGISDLAEIHIVMQTW